jgi:DNA-binding NarL/FixJ family response regulator
VGMRVVLADDHPLFLEALTIALEGAGITVVGKATRGDHLVELVEGLTEVDAVLLDLQMPGYDGFECLDRIRQHNPDVTLIVISATDDEANVRRALDRGAVCFIGKSIDPNDLAAAVRAMLCDAIHLGGVNGTELGPVGSRSEAVPGSGAGDLLTRRELEILKLTSSGLSNAQMAEALWVTEQTVKFHLSNIYRKIGVGNRTGASRWAQQHGLLDDVSSSDGNENLRKMRALPSDTP